MSSAARRSQFNTGPLPADGSECGRRSFLANLSATGAGLFLSGFAGCSKNAATSPGDLAGKRVGISSPHKVEILNELFAVMRLEAEKPSNGVEVVIVDANNDAARQLSDIEAFIAQGYDAVFFLALPSEGLERLIADATKRGIAMFSHGASPVTGCTQNIVLDQFQSGFEVGAFAARWINEKLGGQAEVGVLGNAADPWLQIRTNGLKAGLQKNAPHATIVSEVHGHSIELGAAGAANMLQTHPGIRVLLAHADDPGFGCYTAATEAGQIDPEKFLVASCDGTKLVLDKIAERGIYQATWSYLFPLSATAAMRDIIRALRGEKVPPTRVQVGRLATAATLGAVRKMEQDPQSPNAEKYFTDTSVMRYSEEPLTSPQT
jgi:ribose transport system substrate-binding protein